MPNHPDVVQRANTPKPPSRVHREAVMRQSLMELGNAETTDAINARYDIEHLEELESVVDKAKGFLFRFLARLNIIEWLHLMNHYCLNPLKEREMRKNKSAHGLTPAARYEDISHDDNDHQITHGKKAKPGIRRKGTKTPKA